MDKQQLAAEFNRLVSLFKATIVFVGATGREEQARTGEDLRVFVFQHTTEIAAALTEWAQQNHERDSAIHDAQQKLRAFIGSVESLERLIARLKEPHD